MLAVSRGAAKVDVHAENGPPRARLFLSSLSRSFLFAHAGTAVESRFVCPAIIDAVKSSSIGKQRSSRVPCETRVLIRGKRIASFALVARVVRDMQVHLAIMHQRCEPCSAALYHPGVRRAVPQDLG